MQNEDYINEIKRCIEFHEREAERLRKRLSSIYGQQEGVFSEELRHQLRIRKMTQTELAKLIGVSQKTISRYCSGEVVPNERMKQRILNNVKVQSKFKR